MRANEIVLVQAMEVDHSQLVEECDINSTQREVSATLPKRQRTLGSPNTHLRNSHGGLDESANFNSQCHAASKERGSPDRLDEGGASESGLVRRGGAVPLDGETQPVLAPREGGHQIVVPGRVGSGEGGGGNDIPVRQGGMTPHASDHTAILEELPLIQRGDGERRWGDPLLRQSRREGTDLGQGEDHNNDGGTELHGSIVLCLVL